MDEPSNTLFPQLRRRHGYDQLGKFHLKTSWIRRYVIDKLDDHWAYMVDMHLGINMMERDKVLDYGPEKFNKIIQARLPGISSIFQAYKKVVKGGLMDHLLTSPHAFLPRAVSVVWIHPWF